VTVRTSRGAPWPSAITAISPLLVLVTEPAVSDANAHRPSAVPTKAVGFPVTAVVTGFCAASTLPAGANAVEQPTASGTGVLDALVA
jgi:hypothetical protein